MTSLAKGLSSSLAPAVVLVAVLLGLHALVHPSYVLFHSLVEIFAATISFGTFLFAWHTRRFQGPFLLTIGVAALFVGAFEALHLLAFPGLQVFKGFDANLSPQLWLSARAFEAVAFLVAAARARSSKADAHRVLAVFAAAFVAVCLVVFLGYAPQMVLPAGGLTRVKVALEWGLALAFFSVVALLYRVRDRFSQPVLRDLVLNAVALAFSDLCFTLWVRPDDPANLAGHMLLVMAVYWQFRAVLKTGLTDPDAAHFRDLVRAREESEAIRARLEESQARYRAFFENLHEAVAVLAVARRDGAGGDASFSYRDANPTLLKLLGLDRSSLVGRDAAEVDGPFSPARCPGLRQVLETGTPSVQEVVFQGRSYLVTVFRMDAESVAAAAVDISDRTRAEEALRTHAEGLAFVSDLATRMLAPTEPAALFTLLADRLSAIAGGAAVILAEYDPRARQSAVRAFRCRPEGRERVETLLGRPLEGVTFEVPGGPQVRLGPGRLARVENDLHGLNFGAMPVELAQRLSSALEVGEVWRMACAVEEDLLGTVALVTRKGTCLANRELIESAVNQAALALKRARAEEALRESDQHKSRFLAVLSHELRNPLAPIRNSLYILERAPAGGEQARRAHAIIDRQVGQLTRLVDELLDLTRISSNKVRLQREPLDLGELVHRTAEDHRSLFEKREVALEVVEPAAPVVVSGDRTRLTQIVGNLLHNAAKFCGRGGTTRVVVEAAGGHACVRVCDDGAGMEPQMVARLFQPFIQADTTLDRSQGGLGLGLALVKGLVELHGGTVEARSAGPGKGAEFEVRLPLEAAKAGATAAGAAGSSASAA